MNENQMVNWLSGNAGQTYRNFIGGEWVDSSVGRTSALFEAARPSKLLGHFPDSTEDDVNRAVLAADEAFLTWRKTTASFKAGILNRFAALLERDIEQLAYVISAEQGKVLSESRGEVLRAASEARFAAGEAYRMDGYNVPSELADTQCNVVRAPIGVVAAIAPWNFPIVTPVRKIAPALAYGCTVVLKPASATPWSSVRVMQLLQEAGVPAGVVNLIIGSGRNVGNPLVSHPSVSGISFTGSTDLGLRINQSAASRLAKTQLELGGKNAALVLDYEPLEQAAEQIVNAAFACSGQRCTAISRVIVLKQHVERLVALIKERMSRIQAGPAWEPAATMGPVIDRSQFESVMQYIELGTREGAALALGGERLDAGEGEGYYIAPTLFTGVRPSMTIAREEIFGPVLSVIEAETWQEAIEFANATNYGLATCVFTNRLDLAQTIPDKLDSGMVHVNHGTASQTHMPFGGMKLSGFGAYSIGHSNQDFYTALKAVYVKSN